jgi:hypothetical protein
MLTKATRAEKMHAMMNHPIRFQTGAGIGYDSAIELERKKLTGCYQANLGLTIARKTVIISTRVDNPRRQPA